jgi:hypothetical protein
MIKLFEVAKIPVFLDVIAHGIEKRRDDEVKIVTLSLRVQPFDAKLASAMPDGVRATLFNLNNADPKETLRRVDFALGTPRQNLQVYAAPDTDVPTITFEQVKIVSTYARTEKSIKGYGFCFKASFGPLGRKELEYVCNWHLGQRFVTFEESEPGMFEDEEAGGAEPDEGEDTPEHMFDGPLGESAAAQDGAHRPLHSHQSKRRSRKRAKS